MTPLSQVEPTGTSPVDLLAANARVSDDRGLIDAFGRRAQDLRISLTDKCSLRCSYCMPAEGLDWLSKDKVLSDDEILRLASIFVGLGVTTIRLTGGEPLVRAGVAGLVRRLATLQPRPGLSLTTNALALA
ncbi:MAG: molybdenum cofactor biosynthesis protein MoeA, partial [Frankiales bacterium]|nr:molybdenum cofactor biosynthesis protein MoeA [Frankiales bacterium]